MRQLEETLFKLQLKQAKHDECYHKEIWSLDISRKCAHMALHFSKYASKIGYFIFADSPEQGHQHIVDSIIIATSTANILNSSIYKKILTEKERFENNTIDELSHSILTSIDFKKPSEKAYELSILISLEAGKISKAIESIDHLEDIPFKDSILNGVSGIFRYSLALYQLLGFNSILQDIEERLIDVEKRNLFFSALENYKTME